MKASDIEPGDVIDGWTVTVIREAVGTLSGVVLRDVGIVLLELERTRLQETSPHTPAKPVTETRRTWHRADEDVEAERGE